MAQARTERPAVVVGICIYEALAAGFGVLGQLFVLAARRISPAVAQLHTPLAATLLSWASIALAVGGAITLWLLRKGSVVVLGTRFLLGVVVFVVSIASPRLLTPKQVAVHPNTASSLAPIETHTRAKRTTQPAFDPSALRVVGRLVGALLLLISGAIAAYAYWLFFVPHEPKPLPPAAYQPISSWPAPPR